MPIGIHRLNAKRSQPNSCIVFIKPLKGPDEAIAQDFLERIAAQCVPVMREHCISVMSLEEYEPNREFVGRNFNAGEIIQLVLKSPSTGRWLPFNYVQMVMMHELAHCKQMNHSKAFWAVRNKYAEEMRGLWSKGYTGEGLWGRGASLTTGKFECNTVRPDEVLPEHLCGGTYRSRRRKRKVKDQLTCQQRKERRILKKFGANGVSLGEDEDVRAELEKGRRTTSKPRVAGSKRGRELRAAAALARFDKHKQTQLKEETNAKTGDETASEEDEETASESDADAAEATDINGRRLLDGKGHRMIKVCEDENPDDGDAQRELHELQSSMGKDIARPGTTSSSIPRCIKIEEQEADENADTESNQFSVPKSGSAATPMPSSSSSTKSTTMSRYIDDDISLKVAPVMLPTQPAAPDRTGKSVTQPAQGVSKEAVGVCAMCSFENGPVCLVCSVCSHVLDGSKDPKSWTCHSAACKGSAYLNAGDAGICGVCGERKSAS